MKWPFISLVFAALVYTVAYFIPTPTPTPACEPRAVIVKKKVVVVQEVPAVVLTPVLVAVPQYSVGYDYQGQALQAELQALRLEIARMRASQATPGPIAPAKEAVPNPQPTSTLTRGQRGLAVLNQRCSKCHDSSVADTKGGKHAFFKDGKLLEPEKNAGPMLEQIDAGKMPKDGKLTDAEMANVIWNLTVREDEPKK